MKQAIAYKWVERCAAAAGLLALSYLGVATLQMHAASVAANRTFPPAPGATQQSAPEAIVAHHAPASGVIGRIDIPELSLSAPITDGIGKIELIRGVGHVPGTAYAGGLGTMALAGHRDTFFRGLRRVERGMDIRVAGESGTFLYQVDSTEIVNPDQVEVLDIRAEPALVLVTCYPFDYVGSAPKRFTVHARLLSLLPS